MPAKKSPRKGSLQFWPRKRAKKFLPRVNWKILSSEKSLKGFIGYKAGMASAYVLDNTPDSLTKGKKIPIPVTLIECPNMKILSARFYKDNKVTKEILAKNIEKELKKKLKLPKKETGKLEDINEDYDDIKIIVYSLVKKTEKKKKPDIAEIGLNGSLEEKFNFVKENLGKELNVLDYFEKNQLIDIRGLTKGKGLQGPVKRFGIQLKDHKSEKGRRRPGSIGPWHPARVTFRVPMAGQMGMFTRLNCNNKVIDINSVTKENQDMLKGIKNYGDIKTNYLIVRGSVQGPSKRQLLITQPLRKAKKQNKKEFELLELR